MEIKYKNTTLFIQYQYVPGRLYKEGYVCFIELSDEKDIMLGYFSTIDDAIDAGKKYVDDLKKKTKKKKPKKKKIDA